MAGLVGYKGTLSLYGVSIAELTDLDVSVTREDHDTSDLGDYGVQHAGGRLKVLVTGNANYLTQATALHTSILSAVVANINATGAISIADPKGSTALAGNCVWLDGGFNMPAGPMVQPFRAGMVAITTP